MLETYLYIGITSNKISSIRIISIKSTDFLIHYILATKCI